MTDGINVYATFGSGQGYSGMSEQFAIHLSKLTDVRLARFNEDKTPDVNISAEGHELIKKPFALKDIGITFGFPLSFDSMAANKFKVGYTMFETDKLPSGLNDWCGKWKSGAAAINSLLDLLIVPCHENVNIFRKNGINVPIEVIPNGLNPGFKLMERSTRAPDHKFTFLIMGTLSVRKNSGAVISAFIDAFKGKDDVRLIVKTQSGTHGHIEFAKEAVGDIEIIDGLYTQAQMYALMQEADCFVFPSHGEGFGLPPIEAAATGLPTIIAANSGMMEYANTDYFYVVESDTKVPAIRYPKKWGNVGNWWQPNDKQLKEQMIYVYEHQDEARAKGIASAAYVNQEFDYTYLSAKMLDLITRHYGNRS